MGILYTISEEFAFPVIRKQRVKYANEETAEREMLFIYTNPRSKLPMAEIE